MNKIGGSDRVREELTTAFGEGRGVTARVRWVSKAGEDGRNKWIHCTPLLGINGQIGVWMVVIVDDEKSSRAWGGGGRQAPVVPERSKTPHPTRNGSLPNGYGSASNVHDDRTSIGNASVTSLWI
jgi:hypothetical protein